MFTATPMEPTTSLIEYPCDFPIKIMGKSVEGFAQNIADVVLQHAPDFDLSSMEMRTSSTAKYISLTCTIRATSQVQLDALYRDLCDHPMVVMVL